MEEVKSYLASFVRIKPIRQNLALPLSKVAVQAFNGNGVMTWVAETPEDYLPVRLLPPFLDFGLFSEFFSHDVLKKAICL